jgi:non-ribosomal peptide synthetase-like protein
MVELVADLAYSCEAPEAAPPRLLHEFLELQVGRRPSHIAVECNGETLTYRQLDNRANRLARHLRDKGIGPDCLVALYFGRSINLFVALLAVLKAGGGYVPIDPNFPEDRVHFILADADVALILSERDHAHVADRLAPGKSVCVDRDADVIATQPTAGLSPELIGVSQNHLCYVIYTSGTTGRPKGVMIEHRAVATYLQAIGKVYAVAHTDRVYQGFSIAFDAAVEEIWSAWSAGATLIPGPEDVTRSPYLAARFLEEHAITVFSTVPTFLAMVDGKLPGVRLLILGGETCPNSLALRWAQPGRRLLNTYGPTETTVVATCGECTPGAPVTIGRPLPGYLAYVLDENLHPVALGESGELYIGGDAIARGYIKRPDKDAEAFIENPFTDTRQVSPRLYRTRDQIRLMDDGTFEFVGRFDSQVKIRGFRIELSEIEAVLLEKENIRAAAATVIDSHRGKELAAYVVTVDGSDDIDRIHLGEHLRDRLPEYMVPRYLDVVERLPTLTSGKLARDQLPAPQTMLRRAVHNASLPQSEFEVWIANIWQHILDVPTVSLDDDFFFDLGGHSLLAAQAASALRSDLEGIDISVQDIYEYPTVATLAQRVGELAKAGAGHRDRGPSAAQRHSSRAAFDSLSPWARWSCVTLQLLSLYLFYAVISVPLILFFLLMVGAYDGTTDVTSAIWLAVAVGIAAWPTMLVISIALKWCVIGRYKPGRYPVWGLYYFRWWFVGTFQSLSWADMFIGTPLMSVYYRLMGAKIGRNVTIDTSVCSAFDLVSIGTETSIGSETHILGCRVEQGMLVLGRVDIGERCFVGMQCSLGLDTTMQDGAKLDDLSLLPDGEVMAPGDERQGAPARPARVSAAEPAADATTRRKPFLYGLIHFGLIYAMGYLLLLTALPSAALIYAAFAYGGTGWAVAATFAAVPGGIAWFCLCVIAVKRLILRKLTPGHYALESGIYLRKWFSDFLLSNVRDIMLPLYATLYFPPFLRWMGAEVGDRVEISTVTQISPDLTSMKDESFIADSAIVGGRRIYRGHFELRENRIGRRTFIGNSALVPPGAEIGDNCLIGVLSLPPSGIGAVPAGTRWLGSPSFRLPRTQEDVSFAEEQTYRPSRKLYIARLLIDAVRVLLPGLIIAAVAIALTFTTVSIYRAIPIWAFLAAAPLMLFVATMAAALWAVGVKWVLMGRFRPEVKPLWSTYVWLNEVVNGAYESVAAPAIAPLMGTPFISAFMRLLGCRIGRWVYLDTTLFSEFDLVRIGDHAALNVGTTVQTHLFEDRIMKSSYLTIGDECSIGNMAVVLYDTEMQRGSTLGPLSLLMKGEILPAFSTWYGIPTEPCNAIAPELREDTADFRVGGEIRPAQQPAEVT